MPATPNAVDQLPTDIPPFALPVPSLVICELLGVPYGHHDFFQENNSTLIRRDASTEERMAAGARLIEHLDGLLVTKAANPAQDPLSGLVARIGSGELTSSEAARMGVLLLVAGHETTANMIALGTLALLEHPDQLGLLRDTDDPKPVISAVEELLRYLNVPHDGRRRVALGDIEFAGETIRTGDGIILPNDIANRDPEAFADPDRLDLTRPEARRHIAFAFGVHPCLGQPLARMELQVVYSTLSRRVPTLRVPTRRRATDLDRISFKRDGSVYGVHELPVAWRQLGNPDPTGAAARRAGHTAHQPSSTGSTAPLMCRAAWEARKTSAAACSSGKVIRSESASPGPMTPGPWARASTS